MSLVPKIGKKKLKVRYNGEVMTLTESVFKAWHKEGKLSEGYEVYNKRNRSWESVDEYIENQEKQALVSEPINVPKSDMKTGIFTKALFLISTLSLLALVFENYVIMTKMPNYKDGISSMIIPDPHNDNVHAETSTHGDGHAAVSHEAQVEASHGDTHANAHDTHESKPSRIPKVFSKPGAKPSPEKIIEMLEDGNRRFYTNTPRHPNINRDRIELAGMADQGDYAYATVITCSDSRVPVELIFDAGIMDIFTIRVAGNVINTDEAGSIEYGLAHVKTPVLVVLGHTQCGAVTAVTHALQGHGHRLERNIPPLVASIKPAVERAMDLLHSKTHEHVIPQAIEENVWEAIKNLFLQSPACYNMAKTGEAKIVGAIYDVGTGKVRFLPEQKVQEILVEVETSPKRARNVYYVEEDRHSSGGGHH